MILHMPTYLYEILNDRIPTEKFEIEQNSSDPPLTRHPISKEPVRRVIAPIHLTLKHSDRHDKEVLKDSNLRKHGFSKLAKSDSNGNFEKVV